MLYIHFHYIIYLFLSIPSITFIVYPCHFMKLHPHYVYFKIEFLFWLVKVIFQALVLFISELFFYLHIKIYSLLFNFVQQFSLHLFFQFIKLTSQNFCSKNYCQVTIAPLKRSSITLFYHSPIETRLCTRLDNITFYEL